MTGSKDLAPSTIPFYPNVFYDNQFRQKPVWPSPNTTLSGKTAMVSGGNTGLGYEAALQLLGLKLSLLILAVRSPKKGEEAAASMRKRYPNAKIEVWELDMSSYDSIQSLVLRLKELPRLDLVLLNAGCIRLKHSIVKSTGHEETWQVNYLSTMLLAILLLPLLRSKRPQSAPPARLTIVSAALTLNAKFPNRAANPLFPSLDDPKGYDGTVSYDTSKLLAHFFMWNLVDYISADDVIVNLADPAWCRGTSLARDMTNPVGKLAVKTFGLLGRTSPVGASCFVDALVNHGKESHGCFLMSWKVHP